ncbi:MAG TPA: AraC family transcriptional regulator [Chthoniobacteraceae bacterium]|jgi:AraC-like DNA-binding protein
MRGISSSASLVGAFFEQVAAPGTFLDLFDHVPEVYLFVKDRKHRFMRVSAGTLRLHGVTSESEMIGRTDFDFHPPALAAQYIDEDARVMNTGRALIDQVWLVQDSNGLPQWYFSSKLPVRNRAGEVCGLAGVLRPFTGTSASPGQYDRLTAACEFVLEHYAEPISVAHLAARAHISVSQLQREFQRLFGMTPRDYLLRVRLLMARRQLEQTDTPVGQIALDCGFYDQSHFTRSFRRANALTPLAHRRRFQVHRSSS